MQFLAFVNASLSESEPGKWLAPVVTETLTMQMYHPQFAVLVQIYV